MRAYHGLDFHVLSLTSLAGSCVSSDSLRTCQTWPLLTLHHVLWLGRVAGR